MDPRPSPRIAPRCAARAKRVIYLHMAGSPSQLELFDYKPELARSGRQGLSRLLPRRQTVRLHPGRAQDARPAVPVPATRPERAVDLRPLPHFASVADEVCFIKSMYTDQFNHGPAQLLMHTGTRARRGQRRRLGHLRARLREPEPPRLHRAHQRRQEPRRRQVVWGSGFLPSVYQGVQCRSQGEPVLFLSNPPASAATCAGASLDALNEPSTEKTARSGDPEWLTRIAQYELAFRMQVECPEAFDITKEPPNPSTSSTAPSRARNPSPTTACSPAGWPSAACAISSSSTGAGIPTAPANPRRSTTASRASATAWTAPSWPSVAAGVPPAVEGGVSPPGIPGSPLPRERESRMTPDDLAKPRRASHPLPFLPTPGPTLRNPQSVFSLSRGGRGPG
jgi:hypothetical protein